MNEGNTWFLKIDQRPRSPLCTCVHPCSPAVRRSHLCQHLNANIHLNSACQKQIIVRVVDYAVLTLLTREIRAQRRLSQLVLAGLRTKASERVRVYIHEPIYSPVTNRLAMCCACRSAGAACRLRPAGRRKSRTRS